MDLLTCYEHALYLKEHGNILLNDVSELKFILKNKLFNHLSKHLDRIMSNNLIDVGRIDDNMNIDIFVEFSRKGYKIQWNYEFGKSNRTTLVFYLFIIGRSYDHYFDQDILKIIEKGGIRYDYKWDFLTTSTGNEQSELYYMLETYTNYYNDYNSIEDNEDSYLAGVCINGCNIITALIDTGNCNMTFIDEFGYTIYDHAVELLGKSHRITKKIKKESARQQRRWFAVIAYYL